MSRFSRLLPVLFLLLTASFPAMSSSTQTEPIRQVIGTYGFPEHRVALADSLEIAYVDAGKGSTKYRIYFAEALPLLLLPPGAGSLPSLATFHGQ